MLHIIERATLALLRRVAPRASPQFVASALYIAAAPHVQNAIAASIEGGVAHVQRGPFAGLKMLPELQGTAYLAKLLGTYETQLVPWIEEAIGRAPARIVNVGCGDGYYLSGFATRLPAARCHGFDADTNEQRDAIKTAGLNGLSNRVVVEGLCTPHSLNALAGRNALLLIDCEGGEAELLNPAQAPALRETAMIVELHDFLVPGIEQILVERFSATHRIEAIEQGVALPAGLRDVPEIIRLMLICEHRPCAQRWMRLMPVAH